MFFLIRSIFWLTLVFSTIFSQHPTREPQNEGYSQEQTAERAKLGELARNWIGWALGVVEHKAVENCGPDCLMRLNNLSEPNRVGAERRPAPAVAQARFMPQLRSRVPLPPRRPIFLAGR